MPSYPDPSSDSPLSPHGQLKTSPNGRIVLVPQPSDDPRDPLNWPLWRKNVQLLTIVFLSFMSITACTSNLLAFVVMAENYHRAAIALSYSASAYLAGLIAGPLFIAPLALVVGRPAVLFWCCLAQVACQVWSARMTAHDDYVPFVVSRLFVGLAGCMPPVLAPGFIMDTFFLHQRGRMFALWEVAFLFGSLAPPTISGFIIANPSLGWPWTFWWTIAPLGFAALLVFLFLEETNYDRRSHTCVRAPDSSYIANRFTTFFLGWRVVPRLSSSQVAKKAIQPLLIGIAPVSLIPGLFSFLAFGFAVMVTLLMSIYLQTPEALGGYGFTPLQNAYFSFASWVAALCAWATGQLLGDRIPLMMARRRHGIWQPEFRLANLIIPTVIAPVGLGLIGASLEYHLHFMVLALGNFLVSYAALLCVPVNINYVCECFIDSPVEVGIAFNIWRNALGLALEFFTDPWEEAVGPGWEFGMAAFFVLFAGLLICVVAFKGSHIRRSRFMTGFWQVHSEDGAKLEVDRSSQQVGSKQAHVTIDDLKER